MPQDLNLAGKPPFKSKRISIPRMNNNSADNEGNQLFCNNSFRSELDVDSGLPPLLK